MKTLWVDLAKFVLKQQFNFGSKVKQKKIVMTTVAQFALLHTRILMDKVER